MLVHKTRPLSYIRFVDWLIRSGARASPTTLDQWQRVVQRCTKVSIKPLNTALRLVRRRVYSFDRLTPRLLINHTDMCGFGPLCLALSLSVYFFLPREAHQSLRPCIRKHVVTPHRTCDPVTRERYIRVSA